MTISFNARTGLLACTALASTFLMNDAAHAQASSPAADDSGGLEEIIVTAQKREQSLQDVPIAVTAITQESLQANRIFNVNDLSALAPGAVIKPTPGGTNVPVVTIRGQSSIGITPGSEKQVSIYIDGVYLGSPRGSLFTLPDVQRLEVLRGPQGTLFGRNATAGAISVTTRDPTGESGLKLEGSYGNYNAYRARVTVDTSQFGPFSAYFSFVRNYKRGDIENTAAGTLWDRTNSGARYGTALSPRWLGTTNTNSYFAAVKFAPSDNFKVVYKYDRDDDHGTADGTAIAAYDKTGGAAGALFGNVLTALYTSNNVQFNPSATRPDSVNNAFTVPRNQRVQGHNLTATWKATDSITVKNIAAYRQVYSFNGGSVAGVGPLTFTQATLPSFALFSAVSSVGASYFTLPAASQAAILARVTAGLQPRVGQRIALADSNSEAISKQWSDEVQINYSSDKLQATVGGIWFKSKDETGAPIGQRNNVANFAFVPQTGIIPLGNKGRSFNAATSIAAYAQLEYKIMPQLEIVAGARITRDKKNFTLDYDVLSATTGIVSPRALVVAPTYTKSNPSFLVGLNWTPNDDVLVYGKYSRSFVSGGSTLGIDFAPEVAKSFELGIKADLLDKKLRTNLALFHVDYNHAQLQQGTSLPAAKTLAVNIFTPLYGATIANELATAASLFIIDQGKIRAQGFELEVTAAPTHGLTLGASLGYTDTKYININPLLLTANGGRYDVNARPKMTASLYGIYETQPLFGDATLQFRLDGNYRSSNVQIANPLVSNFADGSNIAALAPIKGYMLVNGRIGLRHLKISEANAEFALWGKNLTNRKDRAFGISVAPISAANFFIPARTYGVDLSIEF
jgi:iron complex outermembrane recepter protein